MNKIEALEKIEELKKFIENEEKRFMPVIGGKYYYLNAEGDILTKTYTDEDFDKNCYVMGNMFRTEKEAELHNLRLISMANKYLPKVGEEYFFYNIGVMEVHSNRFDRNDVEDFGNYHIGNCHDKEKQAEEWGRTKSKAFEIGRVE